MRKSSEERPLRVGLISLGCAKNLVDAEIMLGTLLQEGINVINDAGQADVVIVNTCSFIDAAQEESVDTILESTAVREAHRRGQGLVVAGCLPQRFRQELPQLLPEVDAFMGVDQIRQVTKIVREAYARRAEKLASQSARRAAKAKPGGPQNPRSQPNQPAEGQRTGIVRELASLNQAAPETGTSLRGTDHFGHTKTVLSPGGTAPTAPVPLVAVHSRPRYLPDNATPRLRLTPRHFAYMKIAEGCNHPCSFCIIPRMRGSHRSRPLADLVEEARSLLAQGVRELNLISQDSTYYGLDLQPRPSGALAVPTRARATAKPRQATTICSLLRALNDLPGDFWIRLLYTHPAHWTDDLIHTIAECPKVARYVDIPLQHIHDNMLERMRRETSRDYIQDLLRRLREGIPGLTLRTTFIVGFPGETEACFEALLDFIRTTRFERLGVFAYSQEEGTRASKMAGQMPDRIRRQRRKRAMAVQHAIAVGVSESFVGRTLKVLVEKAASARELQGARISSWEHGIIRSRELHPAHLTGPYLIARGEADAPDIDGRVYVRGSLPLGEFAHVRILGHTDYDLIAEPIASQPG